MNVFCHLIAANITHHHRMCSTTYFEEFVQKTISLSPRCYAPACGPRKLLTCNSIGYCLIGWRQAFDTQQYWLSSDWLKASFWHATVLVIVWLAEVKLLTHNSIGYRLIGWRQAFDTQQYWLSSDWLKASFWHATVLVIIRLTEGKLLTRNSIGYHLIDWRKAFDMQQYWLSSDWLKASFWHTTVLVIVWLAEAAGMSGSTEPFIILCQSVTMTQVS